MEARRPQTPSDADPSGGGPAAVAGRAGGAGTDSCTHFGAHLRNARQARSLSLEEIARITRIPPRSLERLEGGRFTELPADVFVRGFVRSYARCVGLDVDETIARYTRCGLAPAPVATAAASELARMYAGRVQEAVPSVRVRPAEGPRAVDRVAGPEATTEAPAAAPASKAAAAPASKAAAAPADEGKGRKKRRRRSDRSVKKKGQARGARKPASVAASAADPASVAASPPDARAPGRAQVLAPGPDASTARPMPAPVLVIDDSDPDHAEQVQAERAARRAKDDTRRSFLPPVLLDNESGTRRGTLTLAVIILVIVATLTMSYLLRRPSSAGDGVTRAGDIERPV